MHGICDPEHNCRRRGHTVWTLVSATCLLSLTVPLLGRRVYRVAGEGENFVMVCIFFVRIVYSCFFFKLCNDVYLFCKECV